MGVLEDSCLWYRISTLVGEKGEKGLPGSDGKSAFQLWLDEGNTGNNMIIGFLPSSIESLPITNDDAYILAISNLGLLVGSIQMDIFDGTLAVWGDDTATDEISNFVEKANLENISK